MCRRGIFLWHSNIWSFSAFGRYKRDCMCAVLKCWALSESSLGSVVPHFVTLDSSRYQEMELAELCMFFFLFLSSPLSIRLLLIEYLSCARHCKSVISFSLYVCCERLFSLALDEETEAQKGKGTPKFTWLVSSWARISTPGHVGSWRLNSFPSHYWCQPCLDNSINWGSFIQQILELHPKFFISPAPGSVSGTS